jgi:peptidoglycan/LPS O-acetylase OafA/YrhL
MSRPEQSLRNASPRIAELDVLRGFSAMTVMVYHYTTIYQYGVDPGIPYGVLAVNLFFMISGFVIFMTLSRARTALDFIISRFSRLFPVFWVAVLFSQTVMWLAPISADTVSWREAMVNLTMLAGPLHVRWVDNVYWSLVIELTFYVIMLGLFLVGMMKHIERLVLPWLLLQIVAAMVSKKPIMPSPKVWPPSFC